MSDALRRALDYVDEDRAAASQQPTTLREAADAQTMWAPTRAYESGRIGTQINANNADIARLRANNRAQEADELERQTGTLQQRQLMYTPEIGRIEDIGTKNGYLRDGASWLGTQLGQMAASAQDPIALSAAGTAAGRAVGAVPRLSAVGKAIQYGSQLGAFGLNQRQMTGEMYGRLRDDPAAFANMTPQEAYRSSNLYGVGAGLLESAVPGAVGHALGGGALRAGGRAALQRGAGATLLKDAAVEGGTELAQEYGQQRVHSAYSPQRDTGGDASDLLNAFAGGAAGGAGLGAPHAVANAAYARTARAGETVKEKAGETVDLLREKAPQVYEDSGVKGVVDLGTEKARDAYEGVAGAFKKATDYLRDEQGKINYPEATRRAMEDYERYNLAREEAELLTAQPPEGLDPAGLQEWTDAHDAQRVEFVTNRLAALEASGVEDASPLLDAITGDDPVAQLEALNQASQLLLERNAAAQVDRKAAVLREFTGTKIKQAAHAVTRAAQKAAGAAVFTGMNVAEGVGQAMAGPKRNAQGTQGESAPLTYDQWMAARVAAGRAFDAHGAKLRAQKRAATPTPAPEQVQAATTAGELFARAAAREDLGGDVRAREDYGRSLAYELSEMAQEYELRGFVRPSVFDALADDLRDTLGKDAQDAVTRMAALEGGSQLLTDMAAKVSNATLRARRPTQLQDQLIAQLPQEHQAEIRKSGAADLQEAVLDIARGRMPEGRIKEIEKAIGGDTLRRMLEIVDGPDEVFSARAQNEAPMFGEQGQTEEFDPDRLTMNDDGEVGGFEKRQAERRVKRGAAPRMYVFPKDPVAGMRTTDSENRRTARNPFEPTSKLSPAKAAEAREAAAAARLMGEDAKPVITRTRPRMTRRDDVNSDGKNTLAHKIAQMEEILGVARTPEAFFRRAKQELRATKGAARAKASEQFKRLQQLEKQFASGDERAVARVGEMMERFFDVRAGEYVVDARSAREVMDEQNMPEAQRMAIFRDYMLQEGVRVREKDAGNAEKYFQLARNAQAVLLDGADGTDTKKRAQRVYRLTAGDRATLRRAMERYFGENYLVVGEQLSDRVPGTMAVGELIEMAKSGAKARDAVRGQVSVAAGERGGKDAATDMRGEMEGRLLNFPQRAGGNLLGSRGNKGGPLAIKTHSLVAWVRNNRRETPDENLSEEKAFLRDLNEGIAAVTNMESVGGLPFVLDKFGREQYFDGRNVPDALQLPNRTGWAFNQKRREGALAEDQWKDAGIMGPRDPSTVEDARNDEEYQRKLANEYAPGEDLAQGGGSAAPSIVGDASNVGYLDPYSDIARRAGVVTPRKKPMQTPRQKRLEEHAVRIAAAKRGDANTKAPDDHAAASLRNTRIDKGKFDRELFNETGLESDKIRDSERTTVEKEEVASRSKDVTAGIGRESAIDAVSKAADRGDRVFANKGERREVTQDGRLVRVDQDLDVAATLENIDRRLRAVNDAREKFAKGKHYAYPLAYALSVKNVQELLDSGALSTEESEAFIDRQRQAAQVITTAPAGARLRLAKAMASGYRAVRNYEEADAFLASLGRDAAPEVAAAAAPKSQSAPGGAPARKLNLQGAVRRPLAMNAVLMDMAAAGKTARDMLRFVQGSSHSPLYRELAGALLKAGAVPQVRVVDQLTAPGRKGNPPGKYSRKDNAVELARNALANAEHVFMHEMTHAATLKALDAGTPASREMRAVFEHVRKSGVADGHNAMRNIGEFVAEAFTDPKFQQILRSTPAPRAGDGTVLGWLGRAVRAILGVGESHKSAFDAFMDLGGAVMREDSALRGGERRLNAQKINDAPAPNDADVAAARAYVDKVLGPQIKTEFEAITDYSGEWIEAENLIKVSTLTNAGVMNVARHEALHAFYSRFVKANPKAQRVLASLTDDPRVLRRLEALLKDEPEALKQLADGEERLAYIHQFAQAGLLKLPHTPGTTLLAKVRKFLRRVFQMVSDQERAVDLLYSFERGDFRGLEPSAAGRVIAKSIDQGTWLKNGTKAFDGVMQAAAALTVPAHTILQESASPTARKIADLFFTNPGDGNSGGKEPGYLNERNQQMRRYNNVFREAVGDLGAEQRRELLEAMQNETPTADVRDPDVADAKERLHGMFERFHRYMTQEKGLRIGKINKDYFPVVYDAEKVRDGAFAAMLHEKYAGELQVMVDAINKKREGQDQSDPINAEQLVDAIVRRIAGENPMDDASLDPLREDGVLRPWFAGGERRTLNFLKPEDRAPFLEKDLVLSMSRYVRQGVRAAEYSSRFGRQGALLARQLDAVKGELEQASQVMLKEGDLKNEKARAKWVSRQYRDVANATGAMEGSLGNNVPDWVRKTNSLSIVYQNVRILPLALFSSFVDPLGIIARGGDMRDAFSTFARGMRDVARTWGDMLREEPAQRQKDEWEALAEQAGVIDAAVFNHLLHDEYASVYLDGRAKKINEVMFKANGMEPFNRAMRVGATQSAVKFIERHADGRGKDTHSARWMAELGFGEVQPHFDVDGRLITDKRVLLEQNPGMTLEQAEAEIAHTHRAINRWVEGAILSPNAAQRPAWASDPHYSMFWHLKQFAYSFHQTIMKRAVSEARHGNVLPLGVFAWYIPAMIAADVTKGMMLGAGELPNYMKGYDLGDWITHGVNRAGVLGVGDIAVQAADDPLGLAGPMVEQIADIFTDPVEQNITRALPAHALYARALS